MALNADEHHANKACNVVEQYHRPTAILFGFEIPRLVNVQDSVSCILRLGIFTQSSITIRLGLLSDLR